MSTGEVDKFGQSLIINQNYKLFQSGLQAGPGAEQHLQTLQWWWWWWGWWWMMMMMIVMMMGMMMNDDDDDDNGNDDDDDDQYNDNRLLQYIGLMVKGIIFHYK